MACGCGGEILIQCIPANQLFEIAKLARRSNNQFVAIEKEKLILDVAMIGLIGAVLNEISIAQISFFEKQELVITSCGKCGLIFCSGCHNPFVADPARDYTCIFCGGQ